MESTRSAVNCPKKLLFRNGPKNDPNLASYLSHFLHFSPHNESARRRKLLERGRQLGPHVLEFGALSLKWAGPKASCLNSKRNTADLCLWFYGGPRGGSIFLCCEVPLYGFRERTWSAVDRPGKFLFRNGSPVDPNFASNLSHFLYFPLQDWQDRR